MPTQTYDGTTIVTNHHAVGYDVTVTEGANTLTLTTVDGDSLLRNGYANSAAMVAAGMDTWVADRMAFCFSLAACAIAAECRALNELAHMGGLGEAP